jgi:hypothetical protein
VLAHFGVHLVEGILVGFLRNNLHTSAYVSIRQHTSAYVSIRQHTSAYVSIRQHTSAYGDWSAFFATTALPSFNNLPVPTLLHRHTGWRSSCAPTGRSHRWVRRKSAVVEQKTTQAYGYEALRYVRRKNAVVERKTNALLLRLRPHTLVA